MPGSVLETPERDGIREIEDVQIKRPSENRGEHLLGILRVDSFMFESKKTDNITIDFVDVIRFRMVLPAIFFSPSKLPYGSLGNGIRIRAGMLDAPVMPLAVLLN